MDANFRRMINFYDMLMTIIPLDILVYAYRCFVLLYIWTFSSWSALCPSYICFLHFCKNGSQLSFLIELIAEWMITKTCNKQSCSPTIFETLKFFDHSVSTYTESPLNPASEEETLQLCNLCKDFFNTCNLLVPTPKKTLITLSTQ